MSNLFKTIIRNFLWFDITPRKELYAELNNCYETINEYDKKAYEKEKRIESLEEELEKYSISNSELKEELTEIAEERERFLNEKLDLERQVWELEDEIRRLRGCCDNEENDYNDISF